jgi:hypothetical protein
MTIITTAAGYGEVPYGSAEGYGNPAARGNSGWEVSIQRGTHYIGTESTILRSQFFGFQTKIALYNTTNLRILCRFPSRGSDAITGGTNQWGEAIGHGLNWVATSTEPSATNDFDISNVNTDIVEQYWRTASGVTDPVLICDTEVAGVFVDTMAILGSNITTSATVAFDGSNDPTFTSVPFTTAVSPESDGDMVYISPNIPLASYRFWRIRISDGTNPDGFVKIGAIVFGESDIFHGECFVDRVTWTPTNYTDSIQTEGETNVQNDRGVKNKLGLTFKNLDFNRSNYTTIKSVFEYARTVLKCLYVPTPEYPKRFMIFGKLTRIPVETHNAKGEDADYVDFNIEVDEAK